MSQDSKREVFTEAQVRATLGYDDDDSREVDTLLGGALLLGFMLLGVALGVGVGWLIWG